MNSITVTRTSAPLGAEIGGVDLSQPIDEHSFQRIVALFHEHAVVFFRNQHIAPAQHVAFSRRMGELEHHVRQDCCRPGFPELFVVSNIVENGKPIGTRDAGLFWHSDLCYLPEPSRASVFYSLEVPMRDGAAVGDTLFADTRAAYDGLPADVKHRIDKLKAVQSYAKGYYNPNRKGGVRAPLTEAQQRRTPDVEHPIVRTHPFTGRKCLFVNEGYTARIAGLAEKESTELLDFLVAHVTRPQFVYRHSWKVGDLLIWDNCATQHKAIQDYDAPLRRHMERATLTGTAPY